MRRAGTAPIAAASVGITFLIPIACDIVSGAKWPSGSCLMRSSLTLPARAATTARPEGASGKPCSAARV